MFARAFAAFLSVFLIATGGCGPRDIVIAEYADSSVADTTDTNFASYDTSYFNNSDGFVCPSAAPTCSNNLDCEANQYCNKSSCSAPTGCCEDTPTCFSLNARQPVCGCDGVTYWNYCLAARAGVPLQSDVECDFSGNAKSCSDFGESCQTYLYGNNGGAVCAYILGPGDAGFCPQISSGICWVPPDKGDCPPASQDTLLTQCSASNPTCVTTCEALQQGGIYRSGACTAGP